MIFPHFARACLLLAACCLLAKPVRSTLDTKEGYKTKTDSTSWVTPTLTALVVYSLSPIENPLFDLNTGEIGQVLNKTFPFFYTFSKIEQLTPRVVFQICPPPPPTRRGGGRTLT